MAAEIIECPSTEKGTHRHRVFLAGGIMDCPDWQSELIAKITHVDDLAIFNPRRANFPMHDPKALDEQVPWEYTMLQHASLISVWFSRGSINPIVLYELGMWVNSRQHTPAFVGIDPEYSRPRDVIIQTHLARPEITIVLSLDALAAQLLAYLASNKK